MSVTAFNRARREAEAVKVHVEPLQEAEDLQENVEDQVEDQEMEAEDQSGEPEPNPDSNAKKKGK
jgi:hypothetical protein